MSKKANVCELSLVAINLVGDQLCQHFNCDSNNTHKCINNNINNNNEAIARTATNPSGDVLGFVTLNSLSVKLSEFRNLMSQQISLLPQQFMFLSKEGWPVSDKQEANLNLYYVTNDSSSVMVMIRRQFEKQRFGVHTMNGISLGFIFAEMEDSGQEIRHLINKDLSLTSREDYSSYHLIDRNGWPVTTKQEPIIKVWDLMKNGVFRVEKESKRASDNDVPDFRMEVIDELLETASPIRKKKRSSEASTIDIRHNSTEDTHNSTSVVPVSAIDQHSNQSTPNISSATMYHPIAIEIKPILISYVRAEAEQHARQLKSELNDLGCNVFLDVDEIEGGHDWQDALNNAVLNCDLFVPLITPQYGYTQWTNREVKLADIKQKQIIPISFLESWPPECLAIQFASTQYIPWKKMTDIEKCVEKGEGERARDIRFWDQPYVRTTATAIAEHYRNAEKGVNSTDPLFATPQPLEVQTPQIASIRSLSYQNIGQLMRPTSLISSATPSSSPFLQVSSQLKKRQTIVISAHPAQKEFVSLIREELSKLGFDVWSTTDMTIGTTTCSSDNIITPDYLSPLTPTAHSQGLEVCGNDQTSDQTLYIGSQYSESSQESQALTPCDNIANRFYPTRRLLFSMSMTEPNIYTQYSDFASQKSCSIFSPEDLDKARNFRHRVDAANIVIMVLSKAYCHSRTCKQQAFYCDFRKKVIPIKFDDFRMPHWLSKLFDDEDMMEHNGDDMSSFLTQLNQKASKLASSSKDTFKCAMSEARIHSLASYISKQLPLQEKKKVHIYIAGSTKFFSPLSESICRAIGQSLASIPFLVLVTGGCYGVAETTGRSFCEERELLLKEKPANLYHILPRYVSQDLSLKARQNPDGTFQSIPFGHTLFIGDSFQERDSVVARVFNYCILIEGGPRSARIAEEFMWNDNIVIPIICTGGAAAGSFDLPGKIHDVPLGVHKDDWSTLVRRDVTAENVAESVKNIICSLVKCRSRKKGREKSNAGHKTKSRINKVRAKT